MWEGSHCSSRTFADGRQPFPGLPSPAGLALPVGELLQRYTDIPSWDNCCMAARVGNTREVDYFLYSPDGTGKGVCTVYSARESEDLEARTCTPSAPCSHGEIGATWMNLPPPLTPPSPPTLPGPPSSPPSPPKRPAPPSPPPLLWEDSQCSTFDSSDGRTAFPGVPFMNGLPPTDDVVVNQQFMNIPDWESCCLAATQVVKDLNFLVYDTSALTCTIYYRYQQQQKQISTTP